MMTQNQKGFAPGAYRKKSLGLITLEKPGRTPGQELRSATIAKHKISAKAV
jgi:hypothetical protein